MLGAYIFIIVISSSKTMLSYVPADIGKKSNEHPPTFFFFFKSDTMGKNSSCFEELKITKWGGRSPVFGYSQVAPASQLIRSHMKQLEDSDSSGFPGPSLR